ncbi:hypothetical protein [Breznakibacter xylanolyticus]|nr:hypothetical protein [Breznakibacter xylanolyticus]
MKTIKMFGLLLMATLVFASCSKDDDDDAADVAGTKWETTYFYSYTKEGEYEDTDEYKTPTELKNEGEYEIIEFKSNKDFYIDNEKLGTWSQAGSTISVTIVYEGETIKKSFQISGNSITFNRDDSNKDTVYTETVIYTKMN